MSTTALIDGDIIAYSVGFAANNDPLENALHSVKVMIRSIVEASGADNYVVYLTGKDNYRHDIATIKPYKGNRSSEKPVHFEDIREYLKNIHDAIIVNGVEADDALGRHQTEAVPNSTIICTIDKDLDMIAGWHYNWRKGVKYEQPQHKADMFFMKQLLMGDVTDNVVGIPNVGDKKAQAIIDSAKNMTDLYWKILEQYEKHYDKPFEAMMETANLLWIQRHEDELWNPLTAEFANEDYT